MTAFAQTFARARVPRTPHVELLLEYLARPLAHSIPQDERYTTPATLAWCLEQAGLKKYQLDVAACRESHHAPLWYGLDHPERRRRCGLEGDWHGDSFGNIPFSQWAHWIATAWLRFLFAPRFKSHSMILPNDRTEQEPWQELLEPFRDGLSPWVRTRYLPQRTKYSGPGLNGRLISNRTKNGGSPFFSSVLVIWSRDPRRVLNKVVLSGKRAAPTAHLAQLEAPPGAPVLQQGGRSYARSASPPLHHEAKLIKK